jgi:hypothetical protein
MLLPQIINKVNSVQRKQMRLKRAKNSDGETHNIDLSNEFFSQSIRY